MSPILNLLVVCASLGADPVAIEPVYQNYNRAWEVAKAEKLPILVIINPGQGDQSGPGRVQLDDLQRSQHRRNLLQRYIVVMVDASTPHGAEVQKLFKATALPRVSVIDRNQSVVMHKTSDKLSMEDWTLLLEKHRTGDYVPPPVKVDYSNCPSCQQAAMRF